MANKEMTAVQLADKSLDKAGVLLDKIGDTAINAFDAASTVITKAVQDYGQTAVDAVLWTVRLDAINTLVQAWLLMFMVIGLSYYIWTGFSRRNWLEAFDSAEALFLPLAVVVLLMIGTAVHSYNRVTDVWNYVAVVKPEVYLVKQGIEIVKEKSGLNQKKK